MIAFTGEPAVQFEHDDVLAKMKDAILRTERACGKICPVRIGTREYQGSGKMLESVNPANFYQSIGQAYLASEQDVNLAVETAERAFERFQFMSPHERGELLDRTADIVRERAYELASWALLEVGKSRDKAIGEIRETIDYLKYYAAVARSLGNKELRDPDFIGEQNYSVFTGRGPAVVITPFNFPLAIPAEKIGANIAAGNPVILKPAEQAPVSAYLLAQCFWDAGVPGELLAYLPGRGDVGEMLVRHPGIACISYTGSRAVGIRIDRAAAETPGRYGIKKRDLERGGNNPIIVTPSGVSLATINGIVDSKLPGAGQFCSSVQRLFLVGDIDKDWLKLFHETIGSKPFGPPKDGYRYGPVISEAALSRIGARIADIAAAHDSSWKPLAKPVVWVAMSKNTGYFQGPVVFQCENEFHESPLAQEEIFAPVLFEYHVRTLGEAIAMANAVPDKLTAGIYTENEDEIAEFVKRIRVPNPYVHRGTTGAVVRRQLFGDEKVGTEDRVMRLALEKSVCESMMRSGVYIG